MTLRIKYIASMVSLSVMMTGFQPRQVNAESMPIVDIRFDAPYQQIESSYGDEWAPTWGREDVLYTANDDGRSFGGIPDSALTFGKLSGNDPYHLRGTSINGMQDLYEPEEVMWKTLDSYNIHGMRIRFGLCHSHSAGSERSCLMTSSDSGKTWSESGSGNPLFQNTKFGAPSFIRYGKKWLSILALWDPQADQYVYATSPGGVIDGQDSYIIGRVLAKKLSEGSAADWSFQLEDGSWTGNLEVAAPMPNSATFIGPDGTNWKATNTYSVDGVLYMFVTRGFHNASIVKSTNNGLTWLRTAENNYKRPMFPGKRFGAPYFVWYGQDGKANVDDADQYVYAVSNNGSFEGGDDYVLGRVLRSRLPSLSATDWSFYRTGDGMQAKSWTKDLNQAIAILSNPGHANMTGMTYIQGVGRYVMVVWHYSQADFRVGIQKNDLGTVLEFFEASKPWGPWTKVKTFHTGRLGWYVPIIGQRFQTIVDSDTVKAFLYAPGFSTKPDGGLDLALYKLNFMPITLSTKPLQHKDPTYAGGR